MATVDGDDYTYDRRVIPNKRGGVTVVTPEPLTPYPERNDRRVSELECTTDWMVEALRHFERWAMLLEARTEILENLVRHQDAWLTAVDERLKNTELRLALLDVQLPAIDARLAHIEALLHKALNAAGNHDD